MILVGDPHTLTLKTVNADNNSTDIQGKSLWQISVEGDSPVVENDTNGNAMASNVKANDPVFLSLTEPGRDNYVVEKIELKTEGNVYAGGVQYVGADYSFYMPDANTTCTVYLRAKKSDNVSLVGCLSYVSSRGTASFENGGTAISSCKVGDTVMVRATAAEGYTFAPDDIVITRLSDTGTLTRGTKVEDGNFVPVYEDKGSGAVLTGWIFQMPQGGVRVTVNFKRTEAYGLDLTVVDQDKTSLKGNGYVSIQYNGNSFTDLSKDLGKVSYGYAVTVSLTDVGKSLYNLTKVTVDGVTCYDNGSYYGFYMPNKEAVINVTLTAKTAATNTYKLLSSYDYNKGTVGFFVDGNPVNSAEEKSTVDIMLTPADGYMLDSYNIIRNTDNVTVIEKSKLASNDTTTVKVFMGNEADKPSGTSVDGCANDGITVTANFVKRVYKAKLDIKIDGVSTTAVETGTEAVVVETGTEAAGVETGAGETTTGTGAGTGASGTADKTANLIQFKGADGKYKAVQNGSEVEVVFEGNVNIGLTSTGSGYKIVKYVIYSATNPETKLAEVDCNCNDFNFQVTKDGVSKIEITLKAK